MLTKLIKFAIKFKIIDFHHPHIPFCNFQNSVSEKMLCCLTFVCVYIIRSFNEKFEANVVYFDLISILLVYSVLFYDKFDF